MRFPDSIYVHDRTTQTSTLLLETDKIIDGFLGIAGGALFGSSTDGVYRIELDGSDHRLVTSRADAVAMADGVIYTLDPEPPGENRGLVAAFGVGDESRRELGDWAGWPNWIGVRGDRVAWHGSEHVGVGDGAVSVVVDEGTAVRPPATGICEANPFGTPLLVADSLIFSQWPGATLYACSLAGGGPTQLWASDLFDTVLKTVRGDASLLAVQDHDGLLTLLRFPWPI